MDFKVYPDSRIAKLPRLLQFPALLIRNLILKPSWMGRKTSSDSFAFAADGTGTNHFCPFLADSEFDAAYKQMIAWWFDQPLDCRWRMWVLTRCARQCGRLPGSFVEFGVYRGGCAFMILSTSSLAENRRYFLFDTFAGIPETHLTPGESAMGFAGRLSNTSVSFVRNVLQAWDKQLTFVAGDVFDTLPKTETGDVAFCHLDLNASQPTQASLDYVYPRLLPGAMLVMDDYGWAGYEDQRAVIDRFFAAKKESVLCLPTGQALVVKL